MRTLRDVRKRRLLFALLATPWVGAAFGALVLVGAPAFLSGSAAGAIEAFVEVLILAMLIAWACAIVFGAPTVLLFRRYGLSNPKQFLAGGVLCASPPAILILSESTNAFAVAFSAAFLIAGALSGGTFWVFTLGYGRQAT